MLLANVPLGMSTTLSLPANSCPQIGEWTTTDWGRASRFPCRREEIFESGDNECEWKDRKDEKVKEF